MLQDHPIILNTCFALGILTLTWVSIRVNHIAFEKIRERKEFLHLVFLERVINAFIFIGGVILALSVFGGIDSIWRTLLGGTAIVSAVLAFAAQDVIKDILAGLMITLYKPFEIGNRVELEDGTAGVISDITMRHVVLKSIDSQVIVIPNSKLNAMSLKNYSYHAETRSMLLQFDVAYDTDVEKAMRLIRQTIIDSKYTIPGKETVLGMEYGPVYFLSYEASSLRLATTVYYESSVAYETVRSDINLRVNKTLKENGIEIPYAYVNIVQHEDGEEPEEQHE